MHCVEKLENAKKWKRTNCYNSTTDESLVLVGHSFFTTCILFVLCFCFTKMKSNWLYHFISLFLFNNLLWALFHTNKYISITPFQLKFKLKKKKPQSFIFWKFRLKNVKCNLHCSNIFSWVYEWSVDMLLCHLMFWPFILFFRG